MSQPKRGRSSQAQNHLITILLALVIAGLSMWSAPAATEETPPTPPPHPCPAAA